MKQVVFDFGGVLVDWNPQNIAEMFTADKTLQAKVLEEILRHPDWLELDRGSFSEPEAATRIAVRSGLSESAVLAIFATVRQSFSPIDETVQFLNCLVEKGIPCYGLSNMSVENYRYLAETHRFFELFSGIVVSGHERTIKPELGIYQIVCERYALDPSDTLFIDDTAVNCQAAERVGMQAVHFQRDQVDFSDIAQLLLSTP